MATLLYKLNGADEDEAEEVRTLLVDHNIDFYETHQGSWGMSLAAVWLKTDVQLEEAKALLKNYEAERSMRVRSEFEEMKHAGRVGFFAHPWRAFAYLVLVAAVIYISSLPYFGLGD